VLNLELNYYDPDIEEIEINQLKENCHALFEQILYETIAKVINQHIEYLSKSKGYKSFAQRFHEGLQLYYLENKFLGEIAKQWKIPWYKARRIFGLENLIKKVQYRTEEKFLDTILKTFTIVVSTTITSEPNLIKKVTESIREYALKKTFSDAYA
ncbi:MAG: hypothetical protein PUP92_31380, partial [Rhizonema sp. PD38]|nr:hypothetical protein [Rhizonema sp. PD38]